MLLLLVLFRRGLRELMVSWLIVLWRKVWWVFVPIAGGGQVPYIVIANVELSASSSQLSFSHPPELSPVHGHDGGCRIPPPTILIAIETSSYTAAALRPLTAECALELCRAKRCDALLER